MGRIREVLKNIKISMYEKKKEKKFGTSVTDDMSYPEFCKLASESDRVFKNFKENPVYVRVLEHTKYEFGLEYMNYVNERSNLLKDNLEVFAENELYGGGVKYYYKELGRRLSPSTLRYVKVLQDLNEQFNLSEMHSITEIGVGYGGQCRLIKCINKEIAYRCIDLPQVCALAGKWIGKYPIDGVSFIDGTSEFSAVESDLVISNYAYSELRRSTQDMYFEKVISCAKHGYITWNTMSERYLDGYTLDEFAAKIENAKIIEEVPLTYEGNAIIIW